MPNQRKQGKQRIAIWLTKTQRIALEAAIEAGAAKDMSDFVIRAIRQQQKQQPKKESDHEGR